MNDVPMRKIRKEKIVKFANQLGFEEVGISNAQSLSLITDMLQEWIQKGFHADMGYLKREPQLRLNPRMLLDDTKSVISLATPYLHEPPAATPPDDGRYYGRISAYALGKDYHKIIQKRLKRLGDYIKEEHEKEYVHLRYFVDATPLLERAFAQRGGIGFTGKNTNLITPSYGSWVFLSELLINIELEPDVNIFADCSECTMCERACPTNALIEPYMLDARKCVSYHTVENRFHHIPDEVKAHMGAWLFGCDVCQNICPYNNYPLKSTDPDFKPLPHFSNGWFPLETILKLRSDDEFRNLFSDSVIKRTGLRGLQRNACIVAGNLNATELKSDILALHKSVKEIPMLLDATEYALERL